MSRFTTQSISVQDVGSSALAQAVAALNAQIAGGGSRWYEMTTLNINPVLGAGSSEGNRLPYSNSGTWNPLDHEIWFVGNDHGEANISTCRYLESTNTWSLIAQHRVSSHGLDHNECDPVTGDLYHRVYSYGTFTIDKKPRGSSTWQSAWATVTNNFVNVGTGCFLWTGTHTALSAGQRMFGVVSGSFGTISGTKLNDASTVILGTIGSPSGGDNYSHWAAYSSVKNVAVMGGGNFGQNRIWKMTSDGTVTELANAPSGCIIGLYRGTLTEDPASGNFLVLSGGNIFELNPDGGGTWAQQTGVRVPPAGVNIPASAEVIGVPISTHGVTMYISGNTGSCRTHLYKHA